MLETAPQTVARRPSFWPLLALSGVIALLLVTAVLLWAHYGPTVFFETIRAGFIACFG